MGQLVFQATLGGQVNLVGPNTASTFNLNVPAASDTLVARNTTDTLTNKTLTSPTMTAPVLGTPASGTLTNCTGLPASTGITGTLGTTNGGTGLSSFTANGVVYASSTSALTTGSALVFDGANLGVGVTPSAWGSGKALEISISGSSIWSTGSINDIRVLSNAYFNGTNYKYGATGYANMYIAGANAGQHQWYNAASGTAGANISFTQAMTLDASGNLGVGTTSPAATFGSNVLQMYGSAATEMRFTSGNSGTTSSDGLSVGIDSSSIAYFYNRENTAIVFGTNNTERARIDSSGNLLVGVTSSSVNMITKSTAQGNGVLFVDNGTNVSFRAYSVSADGYNAAATAMNFGKNSSTSRSVNAGGTINAAGLDYAEYMIKAGDFTVAKGDVVGINSEGKLTNVFADAVSFVVKSTDPSYVGGDVWGSEEALGLTKPTDESTQEEKDAFNIALEAARQKVDRIAFAGQVPVNVMGATAGQYIIPVNDNGAIKGEAVSNPTFEQYQSAVGKVIAIESDGRAKIIVKVA